MVREFSAGGVVIRNKDGEWLAAVIEPAGNPDAKDGKDSDTPAKRAARKAKPVLTLPKGLVDPGEKPLEAALREVREETGLTAELIAKLADIKYVYVRSWGDRERVFKVVSFYLMRYQSGRINNVAEEMRIERDPQMLFRLSPNTIVNRHLRHRRAIRGNPKRALDRTSPTSGSRHKDRPMNAEIGFERRPQDIGQPDLEGSVSLGVVLSEGDDPARPLSHERSVKDEAGEVAPPQRNHREERNLETITMGDRCVEPDQILGGSHQFDPEVDQLARETEIRFVARGPMAGANF